MKEVQHQNHLKTISRQKSWTKLYLKVVSALESTLTSMKKLM